MKYLTTHIQQKTIISEPIEDDTIPDPIIDLQTNQTEIIDESILPTNETAEYYLAIPEVDLNDSLDKLTISSWFKPNYTEGSPEFTVVGKEELIYPFIKQVNSTRKGCTIFNF